MNEHEISCIHQYFTSTKMNMFDCLLDTAINISTLLDCLLTDPKVVVGGQAKPTLLNVIFSNMPNKLPPSPPCLLSFSHTDCGFR